MTDREASFGKQFYAREYYADVPFDANIVLGYATHWARVNHHFRLGPEARVLDAGCGLGYWSMELAKHYPLLEAFDIAPLAVEHVQARLPDHRVWWEM
jgi:cyclopropane fatty-acyl-phospholipid synthase-like methyltransferase